MFFLYIRQEIKDMVDLGFEVLSFEINKYAY